MDEEQINAIRRTFILSENEPDAVNELGTKWWVEKTITNHAQQKDIHGIKLDATCYLIQTTEGEQTYVLVDNKKKAIIEENPNAQVMWDRVNIRKFFKQGKNW